MNQKHKGIVLVLMAACCFACMSVCVRMAGDIPTLQKSFFRNIVSLVIATSVLLREGKGFRPMDKKNWPYLLVRVSLGTTSILANFYAVDRLLMSDASMLNKMSPFFAVIASLFLLKEKLSGVQVLSLVGAFTGALLIIKPSLSNMDLLPSLIGFIGGAFAGISYTIVRLLTQRGERSSYIVFAFSAFSCMVALPKLLFDAEPMALQQVLWMLAAGLCAAGGQFSITGAYRCAPAREISVYDYSQVIFSAILGLLLFGDRPDIFSILGYVLICGMALLNFSHNNKKSHHTE